MRKLTCIALLATLGGCESGTVSLLQPTLGKPQSDAGLQADASESPDASGVSLDDNPLFLVEGSHAAIYASTDRGRSFTEVSSFGHGWPNGVMIALREPGGGIWVATTANACVHSEDQGRSWATMGPVPWMADGFSDAAIAEDGSLFALGGDESGRLAIWRSATMGASWERTGAFPIHNPGPPKIVAIDHDSVLIIEAPSVGGHVFSSRDGGGHFVDAGAYLTRHRVQGALAIDGLDRTVFMAALELVGDDALQVGFYRSIDGASWAALGSVPETHAPASMSSAGGGSLFVAFPWTGAVVEVGREGAVLRGHFPLEAGSAGSPLIIAPAR